MDKALKQNLKQTFLKLIEIDEVYPNENIIISFVENFLNHLEIKTVRDNFNNVIAYIEGKGEPFMLNTHLDTPESVFNHSYNIKGDITSSNGQSILGADPKSGLAILLEFARYIKETNVLTRPIELVFTRGEETGLYGAINLDYSLIKSKMGLVLDEDGSCTNLVIQAPGYYRIDLEIQGKIVHPRGWREGVNGLEIAVNALAKLKQGEIVPGVTFNVGEFHSGTARNTVPGNATVKAELRSFNDKELLRQGQVVEKTFTEEAKKHGARIVIDNAQEFHSYKLNKTHNLFKTLQRTYGNMSLTPNFYPTYGGSDANIFNENGITAVPIGSAYYLAHQYTEYVDLGEMEQLVYFLLNLLTITTSGKEDA